VLLRTSTDVYEVQESLANDPTIVYYASIVECHYAGGKAQYKWTGEGFRRTLNFTGPRELVSHYNEKFEVSCGNAGSYLKKLK
jgi:hypothetical protein